MGTFPRAGGNYYEDEHGNLYHADENGKPTSPVGDAPWPLPTATPTHAPTVPKKSGGAHQPPSE